MTVNSDCK